MPATASVAGQQINPFASSGPSPEQPGIGLEVVVPGQNMNYQSRQIRVGGAGDIYVYCADVGFGTSEGLIQGVLAGERFSIPVIKVGDESKGTTATKITSIY